jgi:hypothetical protein
METRTILIVDSAANKKVEINTAATTFGELKSAAIAAGINISNKDWLEGITKSSPRSDDALLPTNVNYHGTITNNLVYMLTNTNKQIRSGAMNRAEIIQFIKGHSLEGVVKSTYGKNYTNCSTMDLQKIVDKELKKAPATKPVDSHKVSEPINEGSSAQTQGNSNTSVDVKELTLAIITFFKSLPASIKKEVENSLKEVKFSDSDINTLFRK